MIGPKAVADLSLKFDLADEPNYVGGLAIAVVGYGRLDEVVFRTMVKVDVALSSVIWQALGTRSQGEAIAADAF